MKKLFIAILAACEMFFLNSYVTGNALPDLFWISNTKYEAALRANDYKSIIKYGNEIITLIQKEENSNEKSDILVTRYDAVGKAYAALGEYDNSAACFKELYNYASPYGNKYYDYLVAAKAYITQYQSDIRMYTDGGKPTHYSAKNEPVNGVLFGACANGGIRSSLSNESMILIYQELGQSLIPYNKSMMSETRASGCAVEFALNCPEQGRDISNIREMDPYLKEISELFSQYSDVPIYLRFGAEFDIWDRNMTDAESYKTAFRYVSKYFKRRNSNVAMIWSPNQASRWDINIDDYYPGDEYVDWIGMSLYAQRYFLGNPQSDPQNEAVFKTGKNSEPVVAVKDIVEKYGNRKPIMISESGCGHRVATNGEDCTDYALRRLKEYYSYLPMVYPQIKLIAYFDHFVDGEVNDYRLSSNNELKKEYLSLTKTGRFIQDEYGNNADLCYREITDGVNVNRIFPVSCYAHLYGDVLKSVVYFIDDNYVGMSNELPFTTYINAAGLSGSHRLKCVAAFESGKTLEKSTSIGLWNTGHTVNVEISGERVAFDQEPIIYNDRTMVPMRKIFETLGADVSWDGSSKTAIGKRGDRTVKITVGSKKMYVNSKEIDLDTPSFVLSDRTLVPVRAIAEGLGCVVNWDGANYVVEITPKIFKWSDWVETLPGYVDRDLYYVERKEQYRYRDKEYFELPSTSIKAGNYVRTDVSYGDWSEWQRGYIQQDEDTEVQTRVQSEPMRYHYAHWCTGNVSDPDLRYRSGNYRFCDDVTYHDLGWFDDPLSNSADSDTDYTYYVDGDKYRCSNLCWRWFLFETSGGDYTEYRSRRIDRKNIYYKWTDWSEYSDIEPSFDFKRDVECRVVYRYKEK